jgi:hypothetical protein
VRLAAMVRRAHRLFGPQETHEDTSMLTTVVPTQVLRLVLVGVYPAMDFPLFLPRNTTPEHLHFQDIVPVFKISAG